MLMMRPHFLRCIAGRTSRVHRKTLRRLTRIISSHSFVDISTTRLVLSKPALLTRMSTWPSAFTTSVKAFFTCCSSPVQKLQVARRELALEAAINRLDRFHLLILDDLAYVSKDQAETSVLFELISARYERRSTLITANRPFGDWGKVFPDPAVPHSSESTGVPDDRRTTRQSTTAAPCRSATIKPKLSSCQQQSHQTSSLRRGHQSSS